MVIFNSYVKWPEGNTFGTLLPRCWFLRWETWPLQHGNIGTKTRALYDPWWLNLVRCGKPAKWNPPFAQFCVLFFWAKFKETHASSGLVYSLYHWLTDFSPRSRLDGSRMWRSEICRPPPRKRFFRSGANGTNQGEAIWWGHDAVDGCEILHQKDGWNSW